MSFICHIHNYTEYNQQWNVLSAFNPSKCTHLEQWAADTAAPGEHLGVRCLAQGSQLSRGQFLLEPRFEPTTLGYKSDALSLQPQLPPGPGWCDGSHIAPESPPHTSLLMERRQSDETNRCMGIIRRPWWSKANGRIWPGSRGYTSALFRMTS